MKELQERIVDLGFDPLDPRPTKVMFKEKYNEIQKLKNKLQMSSTQHTGSSELIALQEEKDKVHKEMLMIKDQVIELKIKIVDLEKEKLEWMTFKASSPQKIKNVHQKTLLEPYQN